MKSLTAGLKRRRIEAQAYAWVVRIDEDKARHEASLRRWIGTDQEKADIYNRAYRSFRDAAAPAAAIYGTRDVRQSVATASGMRALPYRQCIALAAALMLVGLAVALVISFLTAQYGRPSRPATTRAAWTVATRTGETRAVELRDGSRILLGEDSRLEVAYSPRGRGLTLLHGRAQFEVAHAPDWPFTVTAGGGTVTAHGTIFVVDYHERVGVDLLSGIVEVRFQAADRRTLVVKRLNAGQSLSYAVSAASAGRDAQKVSGMRTYDDVPVGEIIAEVNRTAVRKILLDDAELAARPVFADINIDDSVSVARKLASLLALHCDERQPDVIRLTQSR